MPSHVSATRLQRSKAATNSSRSHFSKVQNWKNCPTRGEPASLWSPLEQKSKMTCSNEKPFTMDERGVFLLWILSVQEKRMVKIQAGKINSQHTKQSSGGENSTGGVVGERAEAKQKDVGRSLPFPGGRGDERRLSLRQAQFTVKQAWATECHGLTTVAQKFTSKWQLHHHSPVA